MTVKLRHTRSTSGRTHVLTVTHPAMGNWKKIPGRVEIVTLTFKETPAFDDQVQGMLIRKYWAGGGKVSPIGIVPDGVRIDPELDTAELERGRPSPRAMAEACYTALGEPESLTPDQFIGAIMTAIRKDREHH